MLPFLHTHSRCWPDFNNNAFVSKYGVAVPSITKLTMPESQKTPPISTMVVIRQFLQDGGNICRILGFLLSITLMTCLIIASHIWKGKKWKEMTYKNKWVNKENMAQNICTEEKPMLQNNIRTYYLFWIAHVIFFWNIETTGMGGRERDRECNGKHTSAAGHRRVFLQVLQLLSNAFRSHCSST